MKRRVMGLAAMAWAAAPLAARAQAAVPPLRRIGFLSASSLAAIAPRTQALRDELRRLGWVEGSSLAIEWRGADGAIDRLPALAAELLRSGVELVVAGEGPAALAMWRMTRTLPSVLAQAGDPVALGLAASLARPGGNVTGLTTFASELTAKQVELLKQAVPRLSRLALLFNPDNVLTPQVLREAESATRWAGVVLLRLPVRTSAQIDVALGAALPGRVDGVLVSTDPLLVSQSERIVSLLRGLKLPAVYGNLEFAEVGGLICYGADRVALFRRSAAYVDRILRGAAPGDLPIEQAVTLWLVLNRRAARELGLTLPPSLLVRADEVVE